MVMPLVAVAGYVADRSLRVGVTVRRARVLVRNLFRSVPLSGASITSVRVVPDDGWMSYGSLWRGGLTNVEFSSDTAGGDGVWALLAVSSRSPWLRRFGQSWPRCLTEAGATS